MPILRIFPWVRTPFGDYALSPAYDLMCTVLHTPHEEDTALDLFKDDIHHPFYETHGYYGRIHFELLAEKMGIQAGRATDVIDTMINQEEEVKALVARSYLSEAAKEKYLGYYKDKVKRFLVAA